MKNFITDPLIYLIAASLLAAVLFAASMAHADRCDYACARTTGTVSAQVCQRVDIGNGFAVYDCGLQPIPPSDEPDARGFIPDVPENSITIVDAGESK